MPSRASVTASQGVSIRRDASLASSSAQERVLDKLVDKVIDLESNLREQLLDLARGQEAIQASIELLHILNNPQTSRVTAPDDDRQSSTDGGHEDHHRERRFSPDITHARSLERSERSGKLLSSMNGHGQGLHQGSSRRSLRDLRRGNTFSDKGAGPVTFGETKVALEVINSQSLSDPPNGHAQVLGPHLPSKWPSSLKARPGFGGTREMTTSMTISAEPSSGRAHVFKALQQDLEDAAAEMPYGEKTWWHCAGLDPNSPTRLLFDAIGLFVLTYDLTVTPYVLAWNRILHGAGWFLATLTAMYWSFDLFLNFFTGFYSGGELEMDPGRIATRYLKTWFLPDMTIVVFEWLSLFLGPAGNRLRIILLVRIGRLVKTVRSVYAFTQVVWIRVVMQYVMLFFAVLWMTHLLCCSWFAVGRDAWSDTGLHWVSDFDANFGSPGPLFEYLSAYHWALQTLAAGTMDISPRSSIERQFNIISLMFGWLFGNMVVSSFVLVMTEIQLQQKERSDKLMMLDRYLQQHNIDQAMRVRVQKQVLQKMDVEKRLDAEDVQALKHLSEVLRLALKVEIYKPHLMRYPLFRVWQQLDANSHNLLINRDLVQLKAVDEGHTVFEAAEDAAFAYIVISGTLDYQLELIFSAASASASALQDEDIEDEEVREGQLVAEAALWSEWIHVGSLFTTSHSEVLTIHAKDFFKVALGHKKLRELSQEYGQLFYQRLISAVPPQSLYPTDLHVPFAEYNEIITSMDFKHRRMVGEAALASLRQAWQRQLFMSGKGLSALEAEVQKGGCVLIQNSEGEVERVVAVTALHLTREDGSIFAQLGKWQTGRAVPDCKLPGCKQEQGESVSDSFHRLLTIELAPIGEGVHMTSIKQESDSKQSSSFGINTKYVRSVHMATIDEDFTIPFCNDDCFYIPRNDVYVIRSSRGQKILYGWVSSENRESTFSGGRELERRLAGLDSSEPHSNEGQDVFWPLLMFDEVDV